MNRFTFVVPVALAIAALVLVACSGTPTPVPTSAPTEAPKSMTTTPSAGRGESASKPPAPARFATKSDDRGSVAVDVKPMALEVGKPVEFDVAMNTHSVDLSDDMVKAAVLRDDSGREYRASKWEGDAAGGHHRSGTLKFPALEGQPKFVELVIKGLAQVPERVFRWELQ